jgi:glucose-6-phosphate dehydrogenase assembly protein OpcA
MSGINISAIERELAGIWREEAESDTEERAVTRARVLTLLVYGDAASTGSSYLEEVLHTVSEAHPLRALVMAVDRAAAVSAASAAVSAACQVQGPRSKQVTCEQVTFTASGKAAESLPSAAAQLLAPDVPVVLWWRDVPDVEDYVFNHLAPMSDRVIIDSSVSTSPRDDLVKLAKTLRENPTWTAVTDFTWQRLTPWREMFASFYDGADHRPYLDRVDRLTIEYVESPATRDISVRAVLLACWLADRLGWQLDAGASTHDDDDNRFVFRAGDREVVARFVPVVRPELEGLISSARLEASTEPQATFSITRAERNRVASEVVLDGRVHASRTITYHTRSEAELLSTELGILGHDRLYEAAVAIAGQMGAVR